jgi:hypothetical protein
MGLAVPAEPGAEIVCHDTFFLRAGIPDTAVSADARSRCWRHADAGRVVVLVR